LGLFIFLRNTAILNRGVDLWHEARGAAGACKRVTQVSNGLVGAAVGGAGRDTGPDRGNAALATPQAAPTPGLSGAKPRGCIRLADTAESAPRGFASDSSPWLGNAILVVCYPLSMADLGARC